MTENILNSIRQDFESRFDWRKERSINNFNELIRIEETGNLNYLEMYPGLIGSRSDDNPIDALKWSILMLNIEAIECFIFGEFQSCILTCGAVVERVFKLEFIEVNESLPSGNWTLGKCIHKLDWSETRISQNVIDLASKMLEPRNNRAHALLEHTDPLLSIMGGPNRGVNILSSRHYVVEPYRGDAKNTITIIFKILKELYGENLNSI